ncbi:metalloprotease 1 precursor [Geopyxis carbonaria]|nr:metalloprotease 1 precursor [Geopyxis carbonaria]
MHVLSLLSLLGLPAALALRNCGTPGPSDANRALSRTIATEARLNPIMANTLASKNETLTIPMYFHVISNSAGIGNLSDAVLAQQAAVINADYAPAGISFTHVNTSRTTNDEWFTGYVIGSPIEVASKAALRVGGYGDLNIYFTELAGGTLGYCRFPEPSPSADTLVLDGCVIAHQTLPGGTAPYDLGRTVTHEVGHWFNLFHTFEGGCSTDGGDDVRDTPAEKSAATGCPVNVDTCTGVGFEGLDPVHNYMDYSDDSCMNQFTPGQVTRMFQMFRQFRGAPATGAPASVPVGRYAYAMYQ